MGEEANIEYFEPIPEPVHQVEEGSQKQIDLKASVTVDYASYECQTKEIVFRPTLMFSTRMYKFNVKNTSKIVLNYLMKIVDSETGVLKEEPYSISPNKGSIAPGCDETFVVKFSPTEIEADFSRLICCKIGNLNPALKPLIIELDGVGERPVCHFEIPPSHY